MAAASDGSSGGGSGAGASGGTDGSLLTITSSLFGADARPVGLQAAEAISEPFLFTVEIVSTTQAIKPDSVLTQPLCVTLASGVGTARYFHGQVRSLRAGGATGRGTWTYAADLVPGFWFARQTADCRVFLKKSVADILTTLFQENGAIKNRLSIQGTPTPRDHTLQYNETDYDFACRLMQEEGYFYYFEHTEDAHTLVVADSNTAFSAELDTTLHVVPSGRNYDVLGGWVRQVATAHGRWQLLDYDLLNPPSSEDTGSPHADGSTYDGNLIYGVQKTVATTSDAAKRDVLAWPARAYTKDAAASRAKLRMEAAEAAAALYEGSGSCGDLIPGMTFKLSECPLTGQSNAEYVVRSVQHVAADQSETAGGAVWFYTNTLTAFPAATTWREPISISRPVMAGIYTALVLAPSGEDIEVDAYGRVKVRLMFDHRADATSDTTIWARVLQPWASNTWGWQHIPRSGNEVAVAFVDGDPDRPIVVGSLYNANMMPVFPLPDQKTKTGLRTRSTLKGETADFSEFSFDDKKGSELVFLHAQKDHKLEVENNADWHVMKAHTLKVDDSQTITIGNGRSVEITKQNDSLTVKQGDLTVETSAGQIGHTALKSYTVTSKTDVIGLSALKDVTVDSKTGNVKITALQSIELSVMGGMASLKIEAQGITLKGLMHTVTGDAMLTLKSPMTQVNGDGMLLAKGGIMMLN